MSREKRNASEMAYRKDFGQRLRAIRNEKKMTQSEFGAPFGINQPTILRYEAGTRLPDLHFLKGIALTYHINLNWLICGVEELGE